MAYRLRRLKGPISLGTLEGEIGITSGSLDNSPVGDLTMFSRLFQNMVPSHVSLSRVAPALKAIASTIAVTVDKYPALYGTQVTKHRATRFLLSTSWPFLSRRPKR